MTQKVFSLFAIALLSFPFSVCAANSDIVITEIAAFEAADHEWIEIYNKGSAPVDLTGWKFFESGTNHSLSAYRGDLIIEPGEYAVIADVAATTASDYPAFQGTLIDSAWTTLTEAGEALSLKDASGATVEQFTYVAAPNFSLERIDPSLQDYSTGNWREHSSGNSIGQQTSSVIQPPQSQEIPASTSTTQLSPPSSPTASPGVRGEVFINEIVADPEDDEDEWIELFNATVKELNIGGWVIEDGSGAETVLSGTLGTTGTTRYRVIVKPKGGLNNAGDRIRLRDASRAIVDEVSYGSWDDGNIDDNAPRAQDPSSLARMFDGFNSFNNRVDFRITTTPTKGTANSIIEKTALRENVNVAITELFPNPATNEKDEFIELQNNGSQTIDLTGWELVNGSGKKYRIRLEDAGQVAPGGYAVISRRASNLSLRNTGGDTIKLYAPDAEEPYAAISYRGLAPKGQSYVRDADGKYVWTAEPTPGSATRIVHTNEPPDIVMIFPETAFLDEVLVGDASDTSDSDDDALTYEWDFGDGEKANQPFVTHRYSKEGLYQVELRVLDGTHEQSVLRTIQVLGTTIGESVNTNEFGSGGREIEEGSTAIVLNEILPNPKGADRTEFIELHNAGDQPVDIGGYNVVWKNGSSKITTPTIIEPNGFILLRRPDIPLNLANGQDTVILENKDGKKLEEISYEDAPTGQSLSRTWKGNWAWSENPTPGAANNVDYIEEAQVDDFFAEQAIPTTSTSKKKSATSANSKTLATAQLRDAVRVTGTVVVAPNILGKNLFYIADPSIQVYSSRTSLPILQSGDRVDVQGTLSERDGERRILVRGITVVGHGAVPSPQEVIAEDIEEDLEGSLVLVRGSVSRIQWPTFYLGSNDEEIKISVKKETGIVRSDVQVGDEVSVTGIVSQTSAGYRLLPRFPKDIVRLQEKLQEKIEIIPDRQGDRKTVMTYLGATAIAFAIALGGLVMTRFAKK